MPGWRLEFQVASLYKHRPADEDNDDSMAKSAAKLGEGLCERSMSMKANICEIHLQGNCLRSGRSEWRLLRRRSSGTGSCRAKGRLCFALPSLRPCELPSELESLMQVLIQVQGRTLAIKIRLQSLARHLIDNSRASL